LNDIVSLEFIPIAFPKKRFGNGTTYCPLPGEKVDGKAVDSNCEGDKFELCMRSIICPDGACSNPKAQAGLVDFIYCFEGKHGANQTFAESCTKQAGLDYSIVQACYSDTSKREGLWKKQLALPYRQKITGFPTVLVDGKSYQSGGPFGPSLKQMICQAYKKKGGKCKRL